MSKLWAEAWTRPGDPAYGRKIAELPVEQGSGTQGHSGVYPASMAIPKSYSRLNEILYTDGATPANGVWSTIKVFSEGTTLPIFEWLPSPLVPAQSKSDGTVEISGSSIDSIVGFARVEPWDWDGSALFFSTFPDWVYGGRNLLGNPGFEDSVAQPQIYELIITATGGTFTFSDGTDTTSAIAWNANANTMETELESDITIIDDINVDDTGAGTEDNPWLIEYVTPPMGFTLTINTGSLTGGSATLTRTQAGSLQPRPWTRAQRISSGSPIVFGETTTFRVSDEQAHTGTYSLKIDPRPTGYTAGAQQVVNVKPGGIYQASIWIYPTSATDDYRFIIRGVDEDFIASNTGGLGSVSFTANTWTQVVISDVNVGDNDQVIIRFSNVNQTGDPAVFYLDDGEFNEGQSPTTVGQMFTDLYLDATVDHLPRVVWDDGTATDTPYLTLDFTGTLDSDGAAWISSDVSLTFRPRMTYLQVLDEFVREAGYEWRVVADVVPGYYLLQLFNPATLGATMPAGIQGGSQDVSSNARYFAPNATNLVLQGSGQLSARASNAGLNTAFGRIEGSQLDLNVTSLTSAAAAASEGVASQARGAEALVYTLEDPPTEPLVRYRAGDTIQVEDPPIISDPRRVSTIEFAFTKSGTEYTVSLGSEALLGQAAVNHQVGVLLRRFQRADELPDLGPAQVFGGGGMMTVTVAASNASAMSQSKADFVCTGSDDQVQIMAAMEICYGVGGGTVWLSEGDFNIESDIVIVGFSIAYPEPMTLEGLGKGSTRLVVGTPTVFSVYVADFCELRDLTVTGIGGS